MESFWAVGLHYARCLLAIQAELLNFTHVCLTSSSVDQRNTLIDPIRLQWLRHSCGKPCSVSSIKVQRRTEFCCRKASFAELFSQIVGMCKLSTVLRRIRHPEKTCMGSLFE